jgi:hypothetical protein
MPLVGLYHKMSIPLAAWSKAWVCDRSLAGIAGSNPTVGHGCLCVVNVVCCQVEVSATSWSLVQRSPTGCGVSLFCVLSDRGHWIGLITRPEESYGMCDVPELNRKAPIMRRTWSYNWDFHQIPRILKFAIHNHQINCHEYLSRWRYN